MELGIWDLERGGGGKGKERGATVSMRLLCAPGRKGGRGSIYIYRRIYGDVMQGKRLVAVFEDDRKYFGFLGLGCGGV